MSMEQDHRAPPDPCNDRADEPDAPAGRTREPGHEQRDGKIKLHLHGKRPVHAVDRAVRGRPEVVYESDVSQKLPAPSLKTLAQKSRTRYGDPDGHRQKVQRDDARQSSSPVLSCKPTRVLAIKHDRAVRDDEPADDEKEIEADPSNPKREQWSVIRKRAPMTELDDVVDHDGKRGQCAQQVYVLESAHRIAVVQAFDRSGIARTRSIGRTRSRRSGRAHA